MLLFKLLVFISSSTLTFVLSHSQIRVKIKSLKCEHDLSVYNGSVYCKIKPTRNGDGNTTAYYTFRKPAYDFWYNMKVLYKFGNIYRPFMVDVDVDICQFFKEPYNLPKILQHLVKTLNEDFPNLLHPCPYLGDAGYWNVNMNEEVGKFIPQVSYKEHSSIKI